MVRPPPGPSVAVVRQPSPADGIEVSMVMEAQTTSFTLDMNCDIVESSIQAVPSRLPAEDRQSSQSSVGSEPRLATPTSSQESSDGGGARGVRYQSILVV